MQTASPRRTEALWRATPLGEALKQLLIPEATCKTVCAGRRTEAGRSWPAAARGEQRSGHRFRFYSRTVCDLSTSWGVSGDEADAC